MFPSALVLYPRAADWNLANPNWKGRLKIVAKKEKCIIKLEERSGELFAMCPVDSHPGLAVEPVSDSSRYFVLRLEESSGIPLPVNLVSSLLPVN